MTFWLQTYNTEIKTAPEGAAEIKTSAVYNLLPPGGV